MLYIKDGRRYKKASDSNILWEAAHILAHQGLSGDSTELGGMAKLMGSQEENEAMTSMKREAEAKDNQSPYKE